MKQAVKLNYPQKVGTKFPQTCWLSRMLAISHSKQLMGSPRWSQDCSVLHLGSSTCSPILYSQLDRSEQGIKEAYPKRVLILHLDATAAFIVLVADLCDIGVEVKLLLVVGFCVRQSRKSAVCSLQALLQKSLGHNFQAWLPPRLQRYIDQLFNSALNLLCIAQSGLIKIRYCRNNQLHLHHLPTLKGAFPNSPHPANMQSLVPAPSAAVQYG